GVRTTRGSRLYEHYVPDEDTPVVERLRAAGAISLGKTNTPELGWKGVTDNLIFGATRNPWNLERTAGGSSGGAPAPGRPRLRPPRRRPRRRRLDPPPDRFLRDLRPQALLRPGPRLPSERRRAALAHRPDDPHRPRRRADARRDRRPRRARPQLAAAVR